MKKILILGATGNFGKALVPILKENTEYSLTLVSRHATSCYKDDERTKVISADVTEKSTVQKLVDNADVVYCAVSGDALPVVARNLVETMRGHSTKRLILMGAVGIYNEIPVQLDDADNVRNNADQIPNKEAVDIVEQSDTDYTVLRPGYLVDGSADDYVLTVKGQQARGYKTSMASIVNLAVDLIGDDNMYVHESISITMDMMQ